MEKNELAKVFQRYLIIRRSNLQKIASSLGLYNGQAPVLRFIDNHPGCTQNEVADAVGVSAASIAFSTKRMQNNGYLYKQTNEMDMRRNKLYLTEYGRELCRRFDEQLEEQNVAVMQGFTDEEKEQMAGFLIRLIENAGGKY